MAWVGDIIHEYWILKPVDSFHQENLIVFESAGANFMQISEDKDQMARMRKLSFVCWKTFVTDRKEILNEK